MGDDSTEGEDVLTSIRIGKLRELEVRLALAEAQVKSLTMYGRVSGVVIPCSRCGYPIMPVGCPCSINKELRPFGMLAEEEPKKDKR